VQLRTSRFCAPIFGVFLIRESFGNRPAGSRRQTWEQEGPLSLNPSLDHSTTGGAPPYSRTTSFGSLSLLQAYEIGEQRPQLVYYAFDLHFLKGADLLKRPLTERRRQLEKILKKAPENIRFSAELRGGKDELLHVAEQFQLEGLIAKKPDSVYESGRRSGAWVKFKITKSQEFVIGGYTQPEGSRKYFGSLLVGYHSPKGLLFAGRVGTGLSEKVLADLYAGLQKLKRATCPFVNLPEKKRGRWSQGITPAIMKRCHWVEPVLVAQVKLTEWTSDDHSRPRCF
jgi:bifunctional non-homologous end joining protein LigD